MGLLTAEKISRVCEPVVPASSRRSRFSSLSASARGSSAAFVQPPHAPPPAVVKTAFSSPTPRWHRAATFLSRPPLWFTLLICAVALVARRPELFLHPQFWAEDGALFYLQGWDYGARMIFEPYAGYLHLTQRLVTVAALQFDPRWAPALFVGASLALTLYVAARTQSSRLPFRPHLAFALAVVLVPDAFEVLLFLVNIQWILAGGLLLLLISADARRWPQHAHDVIAAVVLGFTGPFSVLFAPLFLWRALQRRTRASTLIAVLIIVCASVQAWYIGRSPQPPPETRVALENSLAVPGMRIGASLFAGKFAATDYSFLVETALGILTLAAVAALACRRGPARVERIWLGSAFIVLLAASLFRCRAYLPALTHADFCPRYFFAPQMVFIWLVAALTGDHCRWLARTATVVLLWMLAVNLPRLHEKPLEDHQWPEHAARLQRGEDATIPINPSGWTVTLHARPSKKP